MQLEIGMSTRRNLPPKGTAGLARLAVRGYRRCPLPPPRMMDTIFAMRFLCRKCMRANAGGQVRQREWRLHSRASWCSLVPQVRVRRNCVAKSILVIDDETMILDAIKIIFEDMGYS